MDTWLSQAVFYYEGNYVLEGKVLEPRRCDKEAFDRGEIIVQDDYIFSKATFIFSKDERNYTLGVLDEPYTKCVSFVEALRHLQDGGRIKNGNWDDHLCLMDGIPVMAKCPDEFAMLDMGDIWRDEWILG